ncbi:MAG: ABC transporter permease [Alphaproteobacteria bacterium]|nr:MAG: ABC transporter permease [Alphaproteobacteria bacterium]
MLPLTLSIALSHLVARKRQSAVSVLGVSLGVGVFIAISGMMNGFQEFFRSEIIETNPHIVISDEYRAAPPQPLERLNPKDAIEVTRIIPRDPVRGISGAAGIMEALEAMPGVAATPTLSGSLILRRAGRDFSVSASGIDPVRESRVTRLASDIVKGSLDSLAAVPDGIIIGSQLAERMGADIGDTLTASASRGAVQRLRVVGIFKTGMDQVDRRSVYLSLARQQSLQMRPRIVNEIRIRLVQVAQSIPVAAELESRWGYKSAPWEETNSRILAVFKLQNFIIYFTVSSILIVAGFGIFNIITTVVLEKSRDIAILRAVGLGAGDIVRIFVWEALAVGLAGVILGCGLGFAFAEGLRQIPAPGASDPTQTLRIALPMWRFALAGGLALLTSLLAGFLPARRAGRADPLETIRGAS